MEELGQHRASGVFSAWMSNGVRVHHRALTSPPNQVVVTISFFGGELCETDATRGLTRLSAEVLDHILQKAIGSGGGAAGPVSRSTGEFGGGGRDVHFEVEGGLDAISVRVWGTASDVADGVKLAIDRMCVPTIDDALVGSARLRVVEQLAKIDAMPGVIAGRVLDEMLYSPGTLKSRSFAPEKLDSYLAEHVTAWLGRHASEATPIEVGVAGDISLRATLAMTTEAFGGLVPRARVSLATLDAERTVQRPIGPIERTEVRTIADGRAFVVSGVMGVDSASLEETRMFRAIARVLQARVRGRLTSDGMMRTGSECGAAVLLSAYKGFGLMLVSARVEDASAQACSSTINEEIDRLAREGPSSDELKLVCDELAQQVEVFNSDARYWSGLLSRSSARGIDPDAVVNGAAFYRGLTPEMVVLPLRRLWAPTSRVGLVIRAK